MLKNCYKFLGVGLLLLFVFGCSEDENNSYQPLNVVALDDDAQVFQNAFIEIEVLLNDSNTISDGSLVISNSVNASLEILNNNTPNDVRDDKIRYTPNGTFYGLDTFEYTICASPENCDTATVTINVLPVSPVNFDLDAMPYDTLAEYNFFQGDIANLDPVYGVLPYDLITPLFSDYASKKRFVWMPSGAEANFVNDYSILDFPLGTILIKNFYYENVLPSGKQRILETRLQIRKESGWEFANYHWNEEQTEANFDLSGSFVPITFEDNGIIRDLNYFIPPQAQCLTCHKNGDEDPLPIGMKPQSLNKIFSYSDGEMNQFEKWSSFGYLKSDYPSNIVSHVDYKDETQPLELRVRSYLDINCAHCHSDTGHCNYRPVRYSFKETGENINNLGICVDAVELFDPGLLKIIEPGLANRSVLAYRLNTLEESLRMPFLGRRLKHVEGVAMVEEWINSLDINCE